MLYLILLDRKSVLFFGSSFKFMIYFNLLNCLYTIIFTKRNQFQKLHFIKLRVLMYFSLKYFKFIKNIFNFEGLNLSFD